MAVIPLKQTVRITKPGGLDEWGNPIPGETLEYKCRVDEKSELVRDKTGKEVVSSARILIEKLVDVGYDDTVEFTNELGQTIRRTPLNISVIRDFSGKPWFTEVRL